MVSLLRKFFGSRNDRLLRQYQRIVNQINALESEMQALDDASLRAKTDEFRQRLEAGAALDDLLPEAFAVTRDASVRGCGTRQGGVRLLGAIAVEQRKIAGMRTGEGKTSTARLAVSVNAW